MDEIISSIPVTEVNTDTIVEIDSKLPDAQVDVSKSITVEIQPDTYVLTSSGMYTGNMTGSTPTWILDAIQQQLTTGDGNLMSVLDDMKSLLGSLQLGVNQTISQIENTNISMSALETSLASRIQGNEAAILDIYATKVTPTEAQAIAVQAIGSTFNGNVDAYIGNLASTYTNANSAIATDIRTLQVSYNDQTARIDTVEEVSLSKNATIRSATAPTLITNPLLISGDLWINTTNNVTKSWNGSSWVDITNTNTQQAYTWSATASKLITAPDGSVTGWSFGDGSNTKSNFKIKAENFSISDGTTGYTPFSITGSDINFNGKVSFSSVAGAPYGGSNLLYNSAPMLANETKGWSIGWYNTGIVPTLGAGFEPWRPSGGGSVFATVPGAPAIDVVFDLAQTAKVSVISGMWYEASAYISSHRCTSYVTIAWYDSNNAYIGEAGGTHVSGAYSGALANWSRSKLLAQAPANAARAHFYVRSAVSGTDPYCFVAFAYLGQAVQGQAVFSDWSEGTSAGVSSGEVVNDINNGNTTTINGERLTTGSVTASQIAANTITADRFTSTTGQSSVWTGGGLVSQNFNGNISGNIGSPTSGFRLSSNAAGTSADPNIYGGYIKGGAIEGAQLIGTILSVNDIKVAAVGYPNNYGPIVLIEAYGGATTNISSIFYSRGYSIGYNNKRMCSASQIFILQALTAGGTRSTNVIGITAVSIRVSIDGGPWTAIASSSSNSGTASCAITYTADSTKNVQFSSTHSSKYIDSSTFNIQSTNGQ